MCTPLFALLALASSTLVAVDPLYPPNAVTGASVVAEVHFAKGVAANVAILAGEEPFASSCKSALAQWRLQSEQDQDEMVVVHFNHPHPSYFSGDTKQMIAPGKPHGLLPYPKHVIEAAYPANALGQGSVVLRLDITEDGRVAAAQVIKSLGALTATSVGAVRKWEFVPPQDKKGKRMPSRAYAVFVFRFPVLAP